MRLLSKEKLSCHVVDKMGRMKKTCGTRPIALCFFVCLTQEKYPKILKWKDKVANEFSILFKHKKSPDWDKNFLDFFKELDHLSPTKAAKYNSEPDSDQARKRRCRANLRKLCEDNVLEFVRKVSIDKCTMERYYRFKERPSELEMMSAAAISPEKIQDLGCSGATAQSSLVQNQFELSLYERDNTEVKDPTVSTVGRANNPCKDIFENNYLNGDEVSMNFNILSHVLQDEDLTHIDLYNVSKFTKQKDGINVSEIADAEMPVMNGISNFEKADAEIPFLDEINASEIADAEMPVMNGNSNFEKADAEIPFLDGINASEIADAEMPVMNGNSNFEKADAEMNLEGFFDLQNNPFWFSYPETNNSSNSDGKIMRPSGVIVENDMSS